MCQSVGEEAEWTLRVRPDAETLNEALRRWGVRGGLSQVPTAPTTGGPAIPLFLMA